MSKFIEFLTKERMQPKSGSKSKLIQELLFSIIIVIISLVGIVYNFIGGEYN